MNIKQLETFVRIVELGSFQAAAEALHASTSTVSARVKELERYLGFDVFDRSFHRAQLTARGHDLFGRAKRLVAFTASLSRQVRAPQAVTGLLRLGVVGLVASTWLRHLVATMREDHPGVALRLEVNLTRVLTERLAGGKLDVAIVTGTPADPRLHGEPLGSDEFVWMQRPDAGPAHAGSPLGPADLASRPVLALTEDSHHHPIVRDWFLAAGVALEPAAACNTMTVLATLAMQGLGVALLPRHAYREAIDAGRLAVLRTEPPLPRVPLTLVYRRDRVPDLVASVTRLARLASGLPDAVPAEGQPR